MVREARRYRQSGSDRLEKQPTDLRQHHHYTRDGTSLYVSYERHHTGFRKIYQKG